MRSLSVLLRHRLVAAVGIAFAGCGGATETGTSSPPTSAGGGGSGGAAGGGGSGAGPTASCHQGAACAGEEWCGYATGPLPAMPCGGCGVPSEHCVCESGTFHCGASPSLAGPTTVCTVAGGECAAETAPALIGLLAARFGPGCPQVTSAMGAPTPASASDGAAECCYPVGVSPCLGRPLTSGGVARLAPLRTRSDWAE